MGKGLGAGASIGLGLALTMAAVDSMDNPDHPPDYYSFETGPATTLASIDGEEQTIQVQPGWGPSVVAKLCTGSETDRQHVQTGIEQDIADRGYVLQENERYTVRSYGGAVLQCPGVLEGLPRTK